MAEVRITIQSREHMIPENDKGRFSVNHFSEEREKDSSPLENEPLRTVPYDTQNYTGKMKTVSGKRHILYEEDLGSDGRILNHLVLAGTGLQVLRHGAAEAVIRFEIGKRTDFTLRNRYGKLPFTVRTERYEVSENADGLRIDLRYELLSGTEAVSVRELTWFVEMNLRNSSSGSGFE